MAEYILRKIDDTLWADVKAKAALEERPLRVILLRLLRAYTADGNGASSPRTRPTKSKKG